MSKKAIIWSILGFIVLVGGGITAFMIFGKEKPAAGGRTDGGSGGSTSGGTGGAPPRGLDRAPQFSSQTSQYAGHEEAASKARYKITRNTNAMEALRLGYYLPITMNRFNVPDTADMDGDILNWMHQIIHAGWAGYDSWKIYKGTVPPDSKMKELADGAAHQVAQHKGLL